SGTVNDIKTIRDDWGRDIEIIVIEADDKEADTKRASNDYEQGLVDISSYTVETIISKMVEGGIIGMGGAGFPTHVKYETEEDIQYVLINAAECEPYLTCDHVLMKEYGYSIINGILLFIKAASAKKAILCFEDNKQDVAKDFEYIILKNDLP